MTKQLFVLTSDSGDGSYHAHYTFNSAWITEMAEKSNNGELEYGDLGVDGDGFHYGVLNVPDECTPESMGFNDCSEYESF